MGNAAIILAGGFSTRLGQDKGLLRLAGKPLVKHTLDAISNTVDEQIIVASSKSQAEKYSQVIGEKLKIVTDYPGKVHGPLVGALAGFQNASSKYGLLLPCDTPFINKKVVSLLLELCVNKNAAIPRWPNYQIEPLQAAYRIESAREAANTALIEGKPDLRSMINELRGVRYVSTLVIQQLDPDLKTFHNINTTLDLRKAESMFKTRNRRKSLS